MTSLQYFDYKGFGEVAREKYWFRQAVRIGDRVECSGQGGIDRETYEIPTDLKTQIKLAFENVQAALQSAGLEKGWAHVYKIRSYHVGLNEATIQLLLDEAKRWCPDHQPLWTCLGVQKLALDPMLVEVEVEAYVN